MEVLIHTACRSSGLTRKAAEYYVEQQLVRPALLENGYRDFSEGDVERLKKIGTLRKLGLSVQEIRAVLDGEGALLEVSRRRELAMEGERSRQELIRRLAADQDWAWVDAQLETLERKQTILERLQAVFPGYYGQYISLHFGRYLNEPIVSEEQREAFAAVTGFLDSASFDLPQELREYLDEMTRQFDGAFVADVQANLEEAVKDPAAYWQEHQQTFEQYLLLKQSEAYQRSPACRLTAYIRRFNSASGYNDVFIPAMKRLSNSYRAYHDALERADRVLREQCPNYG